MSTPRNVALEATKAVNIKPLRNGFELSVNADALPNPQKSMAATWVDARVEGSTIALIFGQHLPGAGHLLAALVVYMTRDRVHDLLFRNPKFVQQVRKYIHTTYGGAAQEQRDVTLPTERVVFERASIAYLAQAGEESEARFYRLSAAGMRSVSESRGKLKDNTELVIPIVGVALDTPLLAILVERLVALVGEPGQVVEAETIEQENES